MKRSIKHLPKRTQQELSVLVELITQHVKGCEMIILYGSYARGGYVLWDEKIEFGTHTSYQSDLDILVVASSPNVQSLGFQLRGRVAEKYHNKLKKIRNPRKDSKVSYYAPPQFIVEHISRLNNELEKNQYFYTDIIKEGIMLYDTKAHKLVKPGKLSYKDIKEIAIDEYNSFYPDGCELLEIGHTRINTGTYKNGFFLLHQACERFYSAISLVFTNYRQKNHKLTELASSVKSYSRELAAIFPQPHPTREPETFEEQCYYLLCRAYIEARYNKEFEVTKEQLEYILERVEMLKTVTEKICADRIKSYDLLIDSE